MLKAIRHKIKERKAGKIEAANAHSAFDRAVIRWTAPEYIIHERGRIWKLTMITTVFVAAILTFLYDTWTFSLAIVVFAFVYYLLNIEHPKNVDVKVSDIGIKVGLRKYPFARIKAFWIIYEPPHTTTLHIHVNGDIATDITIQLNGQDPSVLRDFLLHKIPEIQGRREALSNVLIRLLKI